MDFKRALVSGGAGFIGSHLLDKLVEENIEVCVIDNLRHGGWNYVDNYRYNSNVMLELQNVESPELEDLFKVFRPEVVFHLAALPGVHQSVLEPTKTAQANIVGTANLLSLSEKFNVEKFVFASSSSVYGGAKTMPTNEAEAVSPKSPYAFQKYTGEEYCRHYSKVSELDTVCLRYFNVFGPRQSGISAYCAVVPAFLEAKIKGMRPKIHGDGEQSRDFCHVDNIVHANLLAGRSDFKFKGMPINIGCGNQVSVNEIFKMIKPPEAFYVEDRPGDVKHSCADISRAEEFLGYKPIVTFREGMKKTIDWYLAK